MKWEGNRQSSNVEDRRDGGAEAGAAMPGRRLGGGRGIGIGSIAIALLAGWIFGVNPLTVLGLLAGDGGAPVAVQQAPATSPRPAVHTPAADPLAAFVATVLADTEDVWRAQFQAGGQAYRDPRLVLFRGSTPTACGQGQAAMGPFYCPADEKVYIDLAFYDTLRQRLGAPGDFAQAYVIAHEVGHHVQHLLGISDKVQAQRQRVSPAQANALSVRLELQADCLAGVWAHHAQRSRQILEQGDLEEAMNAAAKIGDDALQQASQGTVVPESFTHGSSAQRMRWFRRGIDGGRMADCNSFEARTL
ncbi:KPN_02809 family neutral zinc metallopeptidase [Aquabacterium sp. OR-4]|uniref:KPN_02809 family neutral zinc metallopeptidase n=1 Tax=Aquabacterium sp. OR-4 TaxID=2978127 RepID=UPI0021B2220B|nr:neutral zinc metallopeptidase [Aquabacterium sp. OR-4]MDT7835647.1 neutral zinc metallopeptidase [Aquabacterium sp. OR-4]